MFTSIIVPLDGSEFAERALPYATRLCQATRAQLTLVQAAYVTVPVTNASASRLAAERLKVVVGEAEEYLTQVAQRLEAAGQPAAVRVHQGGPTTTITQEVADRQANLIIMTTHGRTGPGRAIFGSVANELLHQATVPILIVPASADLSWPVNGPLRVLVPLDGSAHSETILGPAAELADGLKADLLLVRVADHRADVETREYLERAANALRSDLRTVNSLVLEGKPAAAIVRAAQDEHASAVAMATHGRTGLARLVMGSVADGVVHSSTIPILVVRPPSLSAPEADDISPLT
jgi:nucleotide-binding universal stress UspA family protein